MYGDRWLLHYPGDHFTIYANIKSSCNTPETKIMLYINCISIKKNCVFAIVAGTVVSVHLLFIKVLEEDTVIICDTFLRKLRVYIAQSHIVQAVWFHSLTNF